MLLLSSLQFSVKYSLENIMRYGSNNWTTLPTLDKMFLAMVHKKGGVVLCFITRFWCKQIYIDIFLSRCSLLLSQLPDIVSITFKSYVFNYI